MPPQCHHKDTFDSICKDRARIINNVLEKITWSTEGAIDWPKVGMYRLLPEVPEGDTQQSTSSCRPSAWPSQTPRARPLA